MKAKKIWSVREDLRPLLKETCKLFPTLLGQVDRHRIFLVGFMARRSRHVARITRHKEPWGLLFPEYDYVIEFHENVFDKMKHHDRLYVMLHECLHIPPEGCKAGTRAYRRLLHHDIEDFHMLRTLYGLNLDRTEDVMKGEKILVKRKPGEIQRFPRLPKLG